MKKKKFCFLTIFAAIALVLSACIFESDDDGLETWLSDRGMPSTYQVQVLNIDNIKATSAKSYLDTSVRTANVDAVVGHAANLTHDLVLDFAFEEPDSAFMEKFRASDSAGALLVLYWQSDFYKSKWFPKKTLPYSEDLDVAVSWKFDKSSSSKFIDSIADISDSAWFEQLADWQPSGSADTTFKIKLSKNDTTKAIRMPLPSALVKDLKKLKKNGHLQLRISFPTASREYRFWGSATDYQPYLAIFADSKETFPPNPFRMARLVKSEEECSDCPVLHGGVVDSLVVEIPPEPILDALSEFYGDEFPYDGEDVRQTVIYAQLTMARDDSKGINELGWPILVTAGSYVDSAEMVYDDSADTRIRRMEGYIYDSATVEKYGHQNLVFHDGDSLTLQVSYGLRDFINRASDGRNLKFSIRLSWPFLQEKKAIGGNYKASKADTLYRYNGDPVYIAENDTVYKYFGYFDYARYDFSTALENPMSIKLWLASKRGDE